MVLQKAIKTIDFAQKRKKVQPKYNQSTTKITEVQPNVNDNDNDNDKEKESVEKKADAFASATPTGKKKYAEFVTLSDMEFENLCMKYGGEKVVKELITILNNYKGQEGKTYKSDFYAIQNWAYERYCARQKAVKPKDDAEQQPKRYRKVKFDAEGLPITG